MTRHLIIPDCQVKPGVDTTHLGWAGEAILEYKPNVVVVIGDFWDLPSLSNYDLPGSKETIGRNILADIEAGNEAFIKLTQPMFDRMEQIYKNKQKLWRPQLHFLFGNHEHRITKVISNDPKLDGLLTPDALKTPGFTRHHFLKIVTIDGIRYCHYFPNPYTGKPIGGTIPNRLNHIGGSFVQGHQQGFLYGTKQYPDHVAHGLVCGRFYSHHESYRPQDVQQSEWNGIIVLNDVRNHGDYDLMPLSYSYLRSKYS